nr:uncharacterized protein LOC126543130 isoform X2 [Dermacentor andersoni]
MPQKQQLRPLPVPMKVADSKLRRKPKRRNCRYWLMRGGSCQDNWFEFKKNRSGKMHRLLYYTGCDEDKTKLFVYDFHRRRCYNVRDPHPRNSQQKNEDGCTNRSHRRRGRRPSRSTKSIDR